MRRQDKYIIGTATAVLAVAGLIDIWQQYKEQKEKGGKFTWEIFNGRRTLRLAVIGGISGGIIGNELYKARIIKEKRKSFSSDRFIKDILKTENIRSNQIKHNTVKTIKNEVKRTLYKTFADDLVAFPEDIGSQAKRTALDSSYDCDIVLPFKRHNSFYTLPNMSSVSHNTIVSLYDGKAIITKKKKASNILFDRLPVPVSIDVLYGREMGNYLEDKKLNLYVRPNYFWQTGTNFKTDIGIQKGILANKPKAREVVRTLKVYLKKNGLPIENVLIDQLVVEALSQKNYGTHFSVTENLLNSMDYIAQKLNNSSIKDYANSNNNLLQKMSFFSKEAIIDLLNSDLKKIEKNSHYIQEIFQ